MCSLVTTVALGGEVACAVKVPCRGDGRSTAPRRRRPHRSSCRSRWAINSGSRLTRRIDIGGPRSRAAGMGVTRTTRFATSHRRILAGICGPAGCHYFGRFPVEGRALDDVWADLAVSFTAVIGWSPNEGDGLRDFRINPQRADCQAIVRCPRSRTILAPPEKIEVAVRSA